MKQVFENIIRNHHWRDALCGTGSTISFTEPLRGQLKSILEKYNITSMLDVPCGDYSWMSITDLPDNFTYTGGDIVDFMIEDNRKKYPGVNFINIDISSQFLPDADLLFCRDCLIHFSSADIIQTFKNIANSNIKYVMLTSYHDNCYNNIDIATGSFRPISFTKPPYDFEDPLESIVDWIPNTVNRDQIKLMNLWPRSAITNFLNRL